MLKRAIAVVATTLMSVGLVVAPAHAADPYIMLNCSAGTQPHNVRIQGGARDGNGAPVNVANLTIYVSKYGGSFSPSPAGLSGMEIPNFNKSIPALDEGVPGTAVVQISGPGFVTGECTYTYDPLTETPGVSGVTAVAPGVTSTVLTTVSAYPVSGTTLTATLEVEGRSGWEAVETVPVIAGRDLALAQYVPRGLTLARFTYHRVGPGLKRYLGSSPEFWFDIRYAQPEISASASVILTQQATVIVRYGTSFTEGSAQLQRKNTLGMWEVLDTRAHTAGKSQFTFAPLTTETYRVVVAPVGESEVISRSTTIAVTDALAITKPSSVVQSKSATIKVSHLVAGKSGIATLQRQSSTGSWSNVANATMTASAATLTYKPGATASYRVVVTVPGDTTVTSSAFTVSYLPAVSVKAPTSVKKGANATFTATHRLAKSGKGYLQVKSGSTWKTVKSFTLKSSGVTSVATKVSKTAYYRIKVGSYYSASVKVTAK